MNTVLSTMCRYMNECCTKEMLPRVCHFSITRYCQRVFSEICCLVLLIKVLIIQVCNCLKVYIQQNFLVIFIYFKLTVQIMVSQTHLQIHLLSPLFQKLKKITPTSPQPPIILYSNFLLEYSLLEPKKLCSKCNFKLVLLIHALLGCVQISLHGLRK